MCWIIPVIVGLISALLGYLIGKSAQSGGSVTNHSDELRKLRVENEKLRKDNSVLREKQTFDFNDKSQFLSESQLLINKYKKGTDIEAAKAEGDSVGKPSDISLSEADVVAHPLYQSLLSQRDNAQLALKQTNASSANLVLTDEAVISHALYQRLQSERDGMAAVLENAKTQATEIAEVSDKEVESHQLYQDLLSKYHSVHDDLQVAKGNTPAVNDADVEKHAVYKDLLSRFNETKTQLNARESDIKILANEKKALEDKSTKLDETAVKKHPAYGELLAKYEVAQNTICSDNEVQEHPAYRDLEQKLSSEALRIEKLLETVHALEQEKSKLTAALSTCEANLKAKV